MRYMIFRILYSGIAIGGEASQFSRSNFGAVILLWFARKVGSSGCFFRLTSAFFVVGLRSGIGARPSPPATPARVSEPNG